MMTSAEKANWLRNARCQVGLSSCSGRATQLHHRRLRKQGGEDTFENLLPVCLRCHGEIHANVRWARSWGCLVPSWADPEMYPALTPLNGRDLGPYDIEFRYEGGVVD